MGESDANTSARELAEAIGSTERLVVFTGAGISTESGIPDFRSKDGIWARYRLVTIQEFMASEDARKEYWHRKKQLYPGFAAAEPNAGHRAIAELERRGQLQMLITQNIDGLHEQAGNSPDKILELPLSLQHFRQTSLQDPGP